MLVGYPPFFSDEPSITCQKILHWKKTFIIPPEAKLSKEATDLLKRMISEPENRLGRNGVDEIKQHPFFRGFDWNGVRKMQAPYLPNVSSEISNENFDSFEEEEPFIPQDQNKANKRMRKFDMHFIDYTYNAEVENEKKLLNNVLKELDQISEQNGFEEKLIARNES